MNKFDTHLNNFIEKLDNEPYQRIIKFGNKDTDILKILPSYINAALCKRIREASHNETNKK